MRVTLQLPDGRIITKNFGHHGIMEIRNGQPTVYMFPDNPPHLQIYAYSLGLGRQRFRAGFELEKNLPKLMLATRRRQFLRVWDQKGRVFQVARIDAERMRYEQLVRFTLPKFAGRADEKSSPHFWVRDGKVIIRGHGVKKKGGVVGEIEYAAIEQGLAGRRIETNRSSIEYRLRVRWSPAGGACSSLLSWRH
jgi:hypothetical protein